MVSISRKRIKRQRHDREGSERLAAYVLAAMGSVFFAYVGVLTLMGSTKSAKDKKPAAASVRSASESKRKNHPDLHMTNQQDAESYNAMAYDILQTLDCIKLLNVTGAGSSSYFNSRRLQEAADDLFKSPQQDNHERVQEINPLKQVDKGAADAAAAAVRHNDMAMDDGSFGSGAADWNAYQYDVTPTAAHLFCVVALAGSHQDADDPYEIPSYWTSTMHCPVVDRTAPSGGSNTNNNQLQLELLQVWSQARADMTLEVLKKTLTLATEHSRTLLTKPLSLWAPASDDGLEYMMNVLNDPVKTADHGGVLGLENNLGAGKLFVDVGSCLGLTSMAIQILYPGTKIVSIEAASPNWLLQQVNWKCNAKELLGSTSDLVASDPSQVATPKEPTILMGGVGPETGGMAKLLWRPKATTSTRSWSPASERDESAVELLVKLRPWHAILAEAEVQHVPVDVLNVDCEGCEYNLIPALKQDEYESISTVLGGVHWGYMPESKLPSSKRGATTHERLCRHENFARTVKECCAFPDLNVISSVPGEVLVQDSKQWPPKPSTVRDVAGNLCDGFDDWAKEHHLHDIQSDWGWFQITSMAD